MDSFLKVMLKQMPGNKMVDDSKKDVGLASSVSNVKAFHHRVLKLEALEACYWLKATGFSEYVRMYEDKKFPVNITHIGKEHVSLDEDSRSSLLRRLETLNKCARLIEKRVPATTPASKDQQQKQGSSANPTNIHRTLSTVQFNGGHIEDVANQSSDANNVSRKRPASKYGVYDLSAVDSLNQLGEASSRLEFTQAPDSRLSRTFSFSGTCQMNNDSMRMMSESDAATCSTNPDCRASVYDNVPDSNMNVDVVRTGDFPHDAEYPQSDAVVDDVVPTSPVQLKRRAELEDDLLSISSSQEEEDDVVNLATTRGEFDRDINNKVMGSVDSGVPSSPVLRSPSVRRRRVRWHSFQQSSDHESMCLTLKIQNLSAGQINVLKKISLLRLTALMERYSVHSKSGWHWTVPKLLKKLRVPDHRDRNVFGAPLLTIAQRTGYALPLYILLAMNFLTRNALTSVGIFRRSGMKSRIEKLKDETESGRVKVDFSQYTVYDIADVLKQYLRELPEPVITTKLAETFIAIYKDVPKELRTQAIKLAIILMPDENREALQTILAFLNAFANLSSENQMDHKNLAVCFTPALFHIFGIKLDKNQNPRKLKRSFNSGKSEKDLDDTMAAQQCLIDLMKTVRVLFTVPEDVMMKCRFSYIEQGDPVSLEHLSQNNSDPGIEDGYHAYLDNCFAGLLQESQAKSKGWVPHSVVDDVELSYKKVNDGYPIRLWRAVVEVNASPRDVLKRFIKERHLWDESMIHWEYVETLDDQTDVFYYETQSISPSIKRDYLTLRSWRYDLTGGSCGTVSTSIKHRSAPLEFGIRAIVLANRCLMEPCGLGRSRITYICRTDLRGKSAHYYNKAIGPWSVSSCVRKVRDSFNCGPDGPETNV
eukprot:gene6972-7757_t